jgi:DNA-binding response OmpR family regulator
MDKKILLVEDDFSIRELYQRVLADTHYNVITADDGVEGLKAVNENNPDLILLDIMMPRMNGIDVLKELKANPKTAQIPVVLLSNLGQESVTNKAKELGAKAYIIKIKITPPELIQRIDEVFAEMAGEGSSTTSDAPPTPTIEG